jgi:hypothetical protein
MDHWEHTAMSTTADPRSITAKGETIYATRLKVHLEPAYVGKYVAIEVDSGDNFLGRTLVEAGRNARAKYPDKVFHFIKVGSPVAQRSRGDNARGLCGRE